MKFDRLEICGFRIHRVVLYHLDHTFYHDFLSTYHFPYFIRLELLARVNPLQPDREIFVCPSHPLPSSKGKPCWGACVSCVADLLTRSTAIVTHKQANGETTLTAVCSFPNPRIFLTYVEQIPWLWKILWTVALLWRANKFLFEECLHFFMVPHTVCRAFKTYLKQTQIMFFI